MQIFWKSILGGIVLTGLVLGPAHAVSVRDDSAINKLRNQSRSIDTQSGHIQEMKGTNLEIQDAIGTTDTVSSYTDQFLDALDEVSGKLGGGFARILDAPLPHERLTAPEDSDVTSSGVPVHAFNAEEEDLKDYTSARQWAVDNFFAYRSNDPNEARKSSIQVAAAREANVREVAIRGWTLAIQAQNAISDTTDVNGVITENLENAESLRSELRALAIITKESAKIQTMTNVLLGSMLELDSSEVLAQSPALLSDRRFLGIENLPQ